MKDFYIVDFHSDSSWPGQVKSEVLLLMSSMSILILRTQTMLIAQVVETLKEKLSKLTPAAAEPALGCSSQTLWKMKIHDILLMLFFAQDLGQKISGGKMFCLALAYSILRWAWLLRDPGLIKIHIVCNNWDSLACLVWTKNVCAIYYLGQYLSCS